MRLLAAALVGWFFADAALGIGHVAGVSTFGRPPELTVLWVLAGLAGAWWLSRAADRRELARRLALVLLAGTLLGQRAVSSDGGLRLLLLAATLFCALPFLRGSRSALVTAAALLLALPGLLGTDFPQGGVLWLTYVLPPAALALLLPPLFGGQRAGHVALALVLATSALCLAALATYFALADGLDLPLRAVLNTRLHVLGLHPNLAVPHLVTTLLLGAALVAESRRPRRLALALALLPVLVALLAVRSRTGLAALLFGAVLLGVLRLRGQAGRWLVRAAAVGVIALLLVPVVGLEGRTALQPSPDMVSKAVSFRSAMWELGRAAFAAAPWHGFGPGTAYVQAMFARPGVYEGLPKDDHPHNVVLAVGEALGWPGLLGLLLLLGASLWRTGLSSAARSARTDEPRLATACTAALFALWAANAIDLGGADATLYPSLVFLLLGLHEAACRADEPAPTTLASARGVRARTLAVGGACALLTVFGLAQYVGADAERRATRALAQAPVDAGAVSAWLDRAAWWQPFDPNVPLLRAQLASLDRRHAEVLAAVLAARALYPGSASLAHQAALVLSAQTPDDPRVAQWLDEAVRLDPYGPESWRCHLDRARVACVQGRREDAVASLLAAVLLNPFAVENLPHTGAGSNLTVFPAGPNALGIPVADLLAAIGKQRDASGALDPDAAARLKLRAVELPQILGDTVAAEAAARELLADDPTYLATRLTQIFLAQGRVDEAAAQARANLGHGSFWTHGDLLEALSRATPLDRAACDAAFAQVLVRMAQDVDVVFEIDTVRRVIASRQRCAERSHDLGEALRLSDALAFAQR